MSVATKVGKNRRIRTKIYICYYSSHRTNELTHYCLKPFSRQVFRSSLRQALIVYRLIDVTLIGNFFLDTFFF